MIWPQKYSCVLSNIVLIVIRCCQIAQSLLWIQSTVIIKFYLSIPFFINRCWISNLSWLMFIIAHNLRGYMALLINYTHIVILPSILSANEPDLSINGTSYSIQIVQSKFLLSFVLIGCTFGLMFLIVQDVLLSLMRW